MSNHGYRSVFRIIIAGALMIGLLLSPVGIASGHHQARAATVDQVTPADPIQHVDDHAHAHNDVESDRKFIGHSHDHNAADHSHDKAGAALFHLPSLHDPHRNWQVTPLAFADPAARLRLDRPPRSYFAA